MIEKLLEYAKNPGFTVGAIAILLVMFLITTLTNMQINAYAEVQKNTAKLAEIQQNLEDHNMADERDTAAVQALLEELLRQEKAMDATHTRLLQGICYYSAKSAAQRDWCMGVASK